MLCCGWQGEEPAVQRNEQRLAALRKLGSSVVPLKQRRLPPGRATPALALCDWGEREVSR